MKAGGGQRQRIALWTQVFRPFSVPLSVAPSLMGVLLAAQDAPFSPWLFLLTLVGTVAIHSGSNLANNYYDFVRGLDDDGSFGPSRLISQGLVSPRDVRNAMILAFAVGIGSGVIIALRVGWPILAVGLVSVSVAYLYSGGPRPMAYLGLGELLVFTFLGIVIFEGSYYVQTLQLTRGGFWIASILGLWATGILVLNDLRDRNKDHAAGKLTLAVLTGRRCPEREFAALLFGSYALAVGSVLVGIVQPWSLLVFLTLPWAARIVGSVHRGAEGLELTRLQGATAALYVVFVALLSTGVIR